MTPDELVTIGEAAHRLSLSPQRVHQLLRENALGGVALPSGRSRHPAGAGRVTASSIRKLKAARDAVESTRNHPRSTPASAGSPPTSPDASAAATAALEFKVHLDSARDELRAERARSNQALDLAAALLNMLRDRNIATDKLDDVAGGYSDALTQLLTPHEPPQE